MIEGGRKIICSSKLQALKKVELLNINQRGDRLLSPVAGKPLLCKSKSTYQALLKAHPAS